MALDLSGAIAAVEALLEDACSVFHDPEGTSDDVFDRTTGKWIKPPNDDTLVWSGPCKIGATEEGKSHDKLTVPLSAPAFPKGAYAVLTASQRLPALVGMKLTIVDHRVSTFSVANNYEVEPHRKAP